MRNLVVCCDGTWNSIDQQSDDGVLNPTNVVRLYHCAVDSEDQLKYYHPGVGTNGKIWKKIVEGGMGLGLARNIMSAYRWLCDNYRAGDRFFLFGFSRGAYTVRCLAGMIASCGLIQLDEEKYDRFKAVQAVYDKARLGQDDLPKGATFHVDDNGQIMKDIHFLGVWDTVGAAGIPNESVILNAIDSIRDLRFPDCELSPLVKNARHAVAIDEVRASFTPTLWDNIEGRTDTVKQVWFPGCHSDVGGGYPETGLSDIALDWMLNEAISLGLKCDEAVIAQVKPDPMGVLHNSLNKTFRKFQTRPRSLPLLHKDNPNVHSSVLDRQKTTSIIHGPYRRTITLAPGESHSFKVFSAHHWSKSDLYLEEGVTYHFKATGTWQDNKTISGPAGRSSAKIDRQELMDFIGGIADQLESVLNRLPLWEETDVWSSRRFPQANWFALIGSIANAPNPRLDGTPEPSEEFAIGNELKYQVKKSGYLYCYPNDAWAFYSNNQGSVEVEVSRE